MSELPEGLTTRELRQLVIDLTAEVEKEFSLRSKASATVSILMDELEKVRARNGGNK